MKRRVLISLWFLCPLALRCAASIDSWLDACERELDCLHGFVLMQHGDVLVEGVWAPFDTLNNPHMLYSHSKSFTSTAVGFLVDDGKLDLDERIVDVFADKLPVHLSENLRQLRIRDLLTMNVGARHTDSESNDRDGDWEEAFLANEIEDAPGSCFRYDSGATFLLSAIVERRSGKKLMNFLDERLFKRLEIKSAYSTTSPTGIACGGWGMNMTTRDMAKFGQLYLNKGVWRGHRVLSEEWITLATARQTWSGAITVAGEDGGDWRQGYGFQFWRCRHGFYRADGANGQLTVVMPKYDAVLSVHAGLDDMQKELDLVWKHLLPALETEERPSKETLERCARLRLRPVGGKMEGSDVFCERAFRFADNNQGIKHVCLKRKTVGWTCMMETASGKFDFPVGFGTWERGVIGFFAQRHEPLGLLVGKQKVAASAAVQADNSLKLRVVLLNAPQKIDVSFRFEAGDAIASGRVFGIGGDKFVSVENQ